MKYTLFITLLFFLLKDTNAQTELDFSKLYLEALYKQSCPIQPINDQGNDYNDFTLLDTSIGEADIVLLGEPSHGDGGAIQMKTRIVKFLHEKKGFDVLLFEADLYAIMYGLAHEKDPLTIEKIAKENIYSCWSESKVSEQLWRYYISQLQTDNPLVLGGIDVRHAGKYSKSECVPFLNNLMLEAQYDTSTKSYKRFSKDLQYLLNHEFTSKSDSVDINNFKDEITKIEEAIKFSTFPNNTRNLNLIAINNLRNLFGLLIEGKNRDAMMAQNFILLSKYIFPNKKIIVWSHNNHNVLDVNTYASFNPDFAKQWHQNETYKGFTYFGTDIFRAFGKRVYSLAITSSRGQYSPAFFGKDFFHADFSKTAKIPTSGKESLEGYLQKKKSANRFIPLPLAQGKPSGYPWFSARLFDLTYEAKMDYTSSFSGIIYLDSTVDLNGY